MRYGSDHHSGEILISYHRADLSWARWAAWQLEEVGYSVVLRVMDVQSSFEFFEKIQKFSQSEEFLLFMLSPDYLDMLTDPSNRDTGLKREIFLIRKRSLFVQVRDCSRQLGLIIPGTIDLIDFVQQDEAMACDLLLAAVQRARQQRPQAFIQNHGVQHSITQKPHFPNDTFVVTNFPRRNLFFTNREDVLNRLHSALTAETTAKDSFLQALSGLGGIGKTQVAVEYAYRYYREYKAILWARATSYQTLYQNFLSIAEQLGLTEGYENDQSYDITAVRRWLRENSDWLLILDNVEDLKSLSDFIPAGKGHIVLTTRMRSLEGLANTIEVEKFKPEDGALFLLLRARIIMPTTPLDSALTETNYYRDAMSISHTMDGLPLALDQVGAYIEETACGLSGYIERYRTQRAALLMRRGGTGLEKTDAPFRHPESVATTWSLSFKKIEQASAGAADLLRLCAFLHPDAIPEEILREDIQVIMAPELSLEAAIAELSKFSLIRSNDEINSLSIHPLVQHVLKDAMDDQVQCYWAKRAVLAVNRVFPEVEFASWNQCQRYLPHVEVCAELVSKLELFLPEAAELLHRAALYLWQRAQYNDAEKLYKQALAVQKQLFGEEHPKTAAILHDLALLTKDQSRYSEALQYFQQALDIREKYNKESPDIAATLTGLGWMHRTEGNVCQAKMLLEQALTMREKTLGAEHPDVAQTLNKLAWVYYDLGKYAESEPLHLRALAIRERVLGPYHPYVAQTLNNLAWLYDAQGRYSEAEKLYLRSLEIRQQALQPDHPYIAQTFSNLALLYFHQARYPEAEKLYKEALRIREQALGISHPYTAQTQGNLALLYQAQGNYQLAESFYESALKSREKALGAQHPHIAITLNNLGELYITQKKYKEAEPLLQRALTIRERALGTEHPHVAQTLHALAELYVAQGRYVQAESLFQKALIIRERALGAEHPDVTQTLNALAHLHALQNKEDKAKKVSSVNDYS